MIRPALAFALLLGGAPSLGQPVPEGIHRNVGGPPHLCGITAPSIAELQARIARQFPPLSGNERFAAYEDARNMRVWTFTTTAHAAHPSATCRTVVDVHGQTTLDQQIDCRSTRENCDALYREFEELNARMRRELERAARAEHPAG